MRGQIEISFILQTQIILLYVVSFWLSNTNRSIEKLSIYECGLEPMGDARMKFDILYYVIGILYLIFDLEIIFLFPLACLCSSLNNLFAFWMVQLFLTILTIGFVYEYIEKAQNI